MRSLLILLSSALLLSSCQQRVEEKDGDVLMSLQFIDRNGISETISAEDKLANFENIDFLQPQPFKKVLRVFNKNTARKHLSILTSYHPNGYVWQYLEVLDGRANGVYKEWYPNGNRKMELAVIEGTADLTQPAQATWVFDGECKVFDEGKNLIASIHYQKGALQGISTYYFPNGAVQKLIPYKDDEIDGTMKIFDSNGSLTESKNYQAGLQQGISEGFWTPDQLQYQENYRFGELVEGSYFNRDGKLIAEIKNGKGKKATFENGFLDSTIQYEAGFPDGIVELFHQNGCLKGSYVLHQGKKTGEEWEYYPSTDIAAEPRPKLFLLWQEDEIQEVKTWYENGIKESQKELRGNKKQGMHFAWYDNGNLMLVEEYEADVLSKGAYYKIGEKNPVSKVEAGTGTVTLYSGKGNFLKKIPYEKGKPLVESIY